MRKLWEEGLNYRKVLAWGHQYRGAFSNIFEYFRVFRISRWGKLWWTELILFAYICVPEPLRSSDLPPASEEDKNVHQWVMRVRRGQLNTPLHAQEIAHDLVIVAGGDFVVLTKRPNHTLEMILWSMILMLSCLRRTYQQTKKRMCSGYFDSIGFNFRLWVV